MRVFPDHAFQRNPIGRKPRLLQQPSHAIPIVLCAAELRARRIAARLCCHPGMLRLNAKRRGILSWVDRWMADTQRNRELRRAYGRVHCSRVSKAAACECRILRVLPKRGDSDFDVRSTGQSLR